MLNCREVTAQASALLDRDLPWSGRLQMQIHLAMCRHCSRFMRQLRLLREALRQRTRPSGIELADAQVQRIIDGLPLTDSEPQPD